MPEQSEGSFPGWVEQGRVEDLNWLQENLHIFWPVAQQGYQEHGRGSIVVDFTQALPHQTGLGHPFGYLPQEIIDQLGDENTQRLIREYDPSRELVTTLLKTNLVSSYRLQILLRATENSLSSEIDHSHRAESPTMPAVEPPDLETLMKWEADGGCEATDGCWVEADGACSHGCQSWLLELGLI